MLTNKNAKKLMLVLFRDFSTIHTITSLAKELKLSRVGIWKILKKLESDNFINLISTGKGKTATSLIKINLNNVLVQKTVVLYLTEEALAQKRWLSNFNELEEKVDFSVIFGSILISAKDANDIDMINISNKNKFIEIQKIIDSIQKTQLKKIHAINFTEFEFKGELKNSAIVDAIKKGVILFGQENFVNFMREVHKI